MLRQPRQLVPFTFERRVFSFYLLDVEFSTDDAAPITSPYVGEVGQLTLVDTGNLYGVSGGLLTSSGSSTGAGDPRLYEDSGFARVAGRSLRMRSTVSSGSNNSPGIGWGQNTNPTGSQLYGLQFGSGSSLNALTTGGTPGLIDGFSAGTYDLFDFVLRGTGYFVFQNKTLLWVGINGSDATLYPVATPLNGASRRVAWLDFARVKDLGGLFDSDYGIAVVHTSASSGSDYAASANGIFDLTITAPGTLANTAGLKFRKNGGDYWKANFDGSGSLILQRYASDVAQGSPVTLGTNVISASASRTLRVITSGSSMAFYTLNGSTWTKQGSNQTDSVLSANTGLSPFADSGWSLGNLDAFPRTSSNYDGLDSN